MKVQTFFKKLFIGVIMTWLSAVIVGQLSQLWTEWNLESTKYEIALRRVKTCKIQKDIQTDFLEACKDATATTKHWPFLKAMETLSQRFHYATDMYLYMILNSWLFTFFSLVVLLVVIFKISKEIQRWNEKKIRTKFLREQEQYNYLQKSNAETIDMLTNGDENENNKNYFFPSSSSSSSTLELQDQILQFVPSNLSYFNKNRISSFDLLQRKILKDPNYENNNYYNDNNQATVEVE